MALSTVLGTLPPMVAALSTVLGTLPPIVTALSTVLGTCRLWLQRLALIALHPVRYSGCKLVVRFTRPTKVQCWVLSYVAPHTAHLNSLHATGKAYTPVYGAQYSVGYFAAYGCGAKYSVGYGARYRVGYLAACGYGAKYSVGYLAAYGCGAQYNVGYFAAYGGKHTCRVLSLLRPRYPVLHGNHLT